MENVLALYRFALLLKGGEDEARRTLLEMLSECAPQLAQLRSDHSRFAFALKKLRGFCIKNGGPGAAGNGTGATASGIDVTGYAKRFSTLPEPGRSALALVYLKLFPAREAASLLDLSFDELPAALRKARTLLQESQPEIRDFPRQP